MKHTCLVCKRTWKSKNTNPKRCGKIDCKSYKWNKQLLKESHKPRDLIPPMYRNNTSVSMQTGMITDNTTGEKLGIHPEFDVYNRY